MERSPETLLEMARDAYVAGLGNLERDEFEELGHVMAVRDELLSELAERFDDRQVPESCTELLAEVERAEARFVTQLETKLEKIRGGLENWRRNKSKVEKYAG